MATPKVDNATAALAVRAWEVLKELADAIHEDKIELLHAKGADNEDCVVAAANGKALVIILTEHKKRGAATMRWELFDKAVNVARKVTPDIDLARSAALAALEECVQASEGKIMARARDRAKDLVRSAQRAPRTLNYDMDRLPAADSTFDLAADNERQEHISDALEPYEFTIMGHIEAGWTNAEIAAKIGVSEETVRTRRKSAEATLERKGLSRD